MAKLKKKKAPKEKKPKKGFKRSPKAKLARRRQTQPERGKLHYLLRNIPKATWKRYTSSRPDARFDLLTHIIAEVAKLDLPPAIPAEGYGATDQPATRSTGEPGAPAAVEGDTANQ